MVYFLHVGVESWAALDPSYSNSGELSGSHQRYNNKLGMMHGSNSRANPTLSCHGAMYC